MNRLIRWEQGRATIDELLARRHLERVPANDEHAGRLLEQARRHVVSARALCYADPELAFTAAYDAARKALTALLAVQGLRPTSAGGHLCVYQASLAQFDPPLGRKIKPFDWMRRTRNDTEYPRAESPEPHRDDVNEAVSVATEITALSQHLLLQLPPYGR